VILPYTILAFNALFDLAPKISPLSKLASEPLVLPPGEPDALALQGVDKRGQFISIAVASQPPPRLLQALPQQLALGATYLCGGG
jgi:hypothetical protein